jgi:uncharacterized membrane protein
MNVHFRYFGEAEIDAERGGGTFQEISLSGRQSRAFLSVTPMDAEQLANGQRAIADLERLDQVARQYIGSQHAAGDGTISEFIAFHLSEAGVQIAKKLGMERVDAPAFLAGLDLCAVFIHARPGAGDIELVVDYSIGREFTDGVLAVTFNRSGEIECVVHES